MENKNELTDYFDIFFSWDIDNYKFIKSKKIQVEMWTNNVFKTKNKTPTARIDVITIQV